MCLTRGRQDWFQSLFCFVWISQPSWLSVPRSSGWIGKNPKNPKIMTCLTIKIGTIRTNFVFSLSHLVLRACNDSFFVRCAHKAEPIERVVWQIFVRKLTKYILRFEQIYFVTCCPTLDRELACNIWQWMAFPERSPQSRANWGRSSKDAIGRAILVCRNVSLYFDRIL